MPKINNDRQSIWTGTLIGVLIGIIILLFVSMISMARQNQLADQSLPSLIPSANAVTMHPTFDRTLPVYTFIDRQSTTTNGEDMITPWIFQCADSRLIYVPACAVRIPSGWFPQTNQPNLFVLMSNNTYVALIHRDINWNQPTELTYSNTFYRSPTIESGKIP